MGMTGMRSLTVDQASGPDRAGLDILGWPCSNGARSERGNDMTTRSNCGAVATAFCLAMVAQAVLAAPAHAYIGPGAGLSAIGTILTLIAAVFLGIVGFVWYPVKRLWRGRKISASEHAAPPVEPQAQSTET